MTELITPVAGGPPPAARRQARYDWANHADGAWHQWRDASPDEDPQESARAADRIRLAARAWATRRGGYAETRQANNGRAVWVAIHLPSGGE